MRRASTLLARAAVRRRWGWGLPVAATAAARSAPTAPAPATTIRLAGTCPGPPPSDAAFHAAADDALAALTDSLEAYVDDAGLPEADVEYSVSRGRRSGGVGVVGGRRALPRRRACPTPSFPPLSVWRAHHSPGLRHGHLRAQQAGAEQAAVALEPGQAREREREGVGGRGRLRTPARLADPILTPPYPSCTVAPCVMTWLEGAGSTRATGTSWATACGPSSLRSSGRSPPFESGVGGGGEG